MNCRWEYISDSYCSTWLRFEIEFSVTSVHKSSFLKRGQTYCTDFLITIQTNFNKWSHLSDVLAFFSKWISLLMIEKKTFLCQQKVQKKTKWLWQKKGQKHPKIAGCRYYQSIDFFIIQSKRPFTYYFYVKIQWNGKKEEKVHISSKLNHLLKKIPFVVVQEALILCVNEENEAWKFT